MKNPGRGFGLAQWEAMVEYVARESLGIAAISTFAVNFSGFVQVIVSAATIVVGNTGSRTIA